MAVEDFGKNVLGRPIEIIQADCQNNPDVAGSLAREWIDRLGIDVVADGGPSSAALVVQRIAAEKKKPYLIVGPASTEFTGPQCTPYGMQFVYDTYAQANSTGRALARTGGETWFFITTDYTFGHSLEKDTTDTITKLGCKVIGIGQGTPQHHRLLILPAAGTSQRRKGTWARYGRHRPQELHQAGI